MSEEESNTKKRALSTLTSLDQSRGDFSAGAGAAEPPRRRQRLFTTNSSVLATLGSSTTPTFDYEKEKLKTEIQDLKASLEHQRTLRTLDQRRFQQTQTRLERQVQFAMEEASDAKSLLDDVRSESEAHIEQLRNAKAEAVQQLRICQEQLSEAQIRTVSEDQFEMALEAQDMLQEKLDAKDEENTVLRQELEKVIAEARSKTPTSTEQVSLSSPSEPLSSPAPPEVLRELNHTRIQLAETERKYRQLKRRADEWQSKAQELVQQREATRVATARVHLVESELRELRQNREEDCASLESWTAFGSELRRALSLESSQKGGPPELATVMRHLDALQNKALSLADDKLFLQKEVERLNEVAKNINGTMDLKDTAIVNATKECDSLREKLKKAETKLQTLQAQEGIWRREAESLRSLVKTYDDVPPKSPNSKPSVATKSLELSLTTAREQAEMASHERDRIAKELTNLTQAKEELQKEHDRVVEKYGNLREALMTERNKAEDAEARAIQAESLAGKGSFNPEETRVLHLETNPLSEAIRERYESEIRSLRRQLEAAGQKPAATGTSAGEVDPSKLHQRLKEQFKEKIGLFREAVYLMTGYKVDMVATGSEERPMFKVRSVYAERQEDHLMFVWPASKDVRSLDLADTELARLLAKTDSYHYMTKFNSLPAFMASVQLSLFEKTTIA